MRILLMAWAQELPHGALNLSGWASELYPEAAQDVLVLGGGGVPLLPEAAGQAFRLPGPEPEQCIDIWQYYGGVADWATGRYDLILMQAGEASDVLAPSIAQRMAYSCLTGVTGAAACGTDRLQAVRPVCSMELEGEYAVPLPAVVTLTPRREDAPGPVCPRQVEELPGRELSLPGAVRDFEFAAAQEGQKLSAAATVLVAGRGIGGRQGVEKLACLARRLGGCVAATRPVAFEGLAPLTELVGASAAILAPERCVVFGASGAAAFTVGVKDSKVLAGINLDPGAPLFDVCDYGVAEDCGAMLDALLELTEERSGP